MVAPELTARLTDHFGAYIATNPALLTETSSICTHYGVSPEDLFYKWEAFAINHNLAKSEPLTIDYARELRKIIASSVNAAAVEGVGQTPLKPSSALNRGAKIGDFGAMLGIKATPSKTGNAGAGAFQTPMRGSGSPFSGATPASASAYKPSVARDLDVPMSDIDSPLRPNPAAQSRYTILESLNEHLPLTGSGSQLAAPIPTTTSAGGSKKGSSARVSLAMATDPRAWNYRYMFEKKNERSSVLDDRIDEYAALLRTAYALDETEELGDPSLPSQEPIWVVGRICPALPAPESAAGQTLRAKASARRPTTTNGEEDGVFGLPKLSETGVVLESSRTMGSGQRTPLVFAKGCIVKHTPQDPGTAGGATTLSLFPGQIVLCRGVNAGADRFSVSEICFPPPLPLAVHTVDEALDHGYSPSKLNGSALNLVVAAGPFTSPSNLDYAAWHELMDALEAGGLPSTPTPTTTSTANRRGVPDVLVLTGPFVSASHTELPFCAELPVELFARHFSTRLTRLLATFPAMTVVLVPSTDDVLNVHGAYPQPAFSKDVVAEMGLPKRVKCLPNPCVFYINELVLGVTTADALGDIKCEEMVTRIEASPSAGVVAGAAGKGESVSSRNKETNTRWSRALLSQRSFYPVYPPPTASGLAYDTSHSHLLGFPAVTPDLVLVPSAKLAKPFIRVVNSATIVQPGTTARSSGGAGSVVSIHINPLPKHELEARAGEEPINANLYDRARIDVLSL